MIVLHYLVIYSLNHMHLVNYLTYYNYYCLLNDKKALKIFCFRTTKKPHGSSVVHHGYFLMFLGSYFFVFKKKFKVIKLINSFFVFFIRKFLKILQ